MWVSQKGGTYCDFSQQIQECAQGRKMALLLSDVLTAEVLGLR
jgi:hypothetical protein